MQTADALPSFVRYLLSQDRSPATVGNYESIMRLVAAYLVDTRRAADIDAFSVETVQGFAVWLTERSLSARSRVTYLSCLSTFLRFVASHRLTDLSASELEAIRGELQTTIRSINRKTRGEGLHKRLPPDEIVKALLDYMDSAPAADLTDRLRLVWLRDRAIVLALQSTAGRLSEIAGLRRGDLNYTQRTGVVTGKGNKTRELIFSPKAWSAITAYLAARADGQGAAPLARLPLFTRHDRGAGRSPAPLHPRSIEKIVERRAGEAGVLERFNLTPHSFRHYLATLFLRETRDLYTTQKLLGHEDPKTTEVYARLTNEDLITAHREVVR